MDTFRSLEYELSKLEQRHFDRLRAQFRPNARLVSCISGEVQFFALDSDQLSSVNPLPVVCAVGINYEQRERQFSGELVHNRPSSPSSVVRSTTSREGTRYVIAAYNRNKAAWTTKPALNPESPMGFYGSKDATGKLGFIADNVGQLTDRFILIMTNTPFITQRKWQEQARLTPAACEDLLRYPSTHLDDLSATRWVWPAFSDLVRCHAIEEWLLSGNINPQSRLWFNSTFRSKQHRLFPWYGPETA